MADELVVPAGGAAPHEASPLAAPVTAQTPPAAEPAPSADTPPAVEPPAPAPLPDPPAPEPSGDPNPYVAIGQQMADERKAAAAPDNPYVAAGQAYANARRASLQSSLSQASETDADRQAKVLALASKTQLPPEVVDRNYDLVAARAKLSGVDVGRLLTQHPELSSWLSKPENAAVAQDDLPVLQTLDHAMRAVTDPSADPTGLLPPGFIFDRSGQIIEPLPGGLADTIGGLDDLRRVLEQRDLRGWLEHVDRLSVMEQRIQQFTADGAATQLAAGALGSGTGSLVLNALRLTGLQGEREDDALSALQAAAARQTPALAGVPGAVGRGAIGLAVDTPLMLLGGSLGRLIPGTTRLARAAQTIATFAPVNLAQAIEATRQHGAGFGAASFLINSLVPAAFPLATGHLGGVAAVLANEETAATAAAGGWAAAGGRFLGELGVQAGQMQAIEAANALHEYVSGVDPDALRLDRLVPRLITAGLLGAGQAGLLHLPVAIGEKFQRDTTAAIAADSYGQRLQSVVDVLRSSATAERSPEATASLLSSLGGSERRVCLQTSDWDAAARARGQDPAQAADAAGVGGAYREAQATGAEVPVPIETFLQAARGEGGDQLVKAARRAPGAMTQEEAQAFQQSLPKTVEALREEVAKAAAATRDEPTQQVHDDLVQQLVAAGTEKATAVRQATILARGFRSLAERVSAGAPEGATPMTALDLYQRYHLQVKPADSGTPAEGDVVFGQPGSDSRRGQISFGRDRSVTVSLFEQKNLSTFLHEGGHLFLEVYGDLAAHEHAPEQIRQDYGKILDWLGAKDRASIGTDQHEQFARGFESYLMEGKAPSPELRSTFARVKRWFQDLYVKVAALGANLTEDVRGVFDRLLATDDEISAAERLAGAKPLFATAADARMSESEFAAYRSAAEKAHTTAVDDLERQLVSEERKAQSEAYKRKRVEVKAAVESELDQQPVFVALRALQDGELAGGEPIAEHLKLDRADIVERYGEAGLKELPGPGAGRDNRGRRVYAVDGGMTLDQGAELFGFATGDDLYRALIAAPDRAREVATMTADRMRQLYPDSRTDGSFVEKAQAAVENDHRSDVLAAELRALRKRQREAAPAAREAASRATALERAKGDQRVADVLSTADAELAYERALGQAKVDVQKATAREAEQAGRQARDEALAAVPPVELLRAVAREAVAAKLVLDLNPDAYLVAARKASRETLRAAAAGDWKRAADAKQQELLSHELYRAARDARVELDKGISHLRDLQKTSTRQRIGKAGGWEWVVTKPDGTSESFTVEAEAERAAGAVAGATFERTSGYLEQLDALLDRFDLRPASAAALRRRQLLSDFIARQREADAQISPELEALAADESKKNWQQLTVDEFRGLVDAAKNIETMARLKNKLLREKDERTLEDRAQQMVSTIEANSRGAKARKIGRSILDKPAEWFGFALASLRKMTSLVREMDGHVDGGPLHELVTRQLNEAADSESVARRAAAVAYHELAKAWGKMGPLAAIRLRVAGVRERMSLEARIAVALNWGNAGNRERLLKANGLSEGEIRSVLDSLDEKDWRFVQGIWDHIDSYWPRIAAKQQRVTGVAPDKVEALPVETRFGTFRGGYYPVSYDPRLSARSHGMLVAEQANLMKAGGYTAATTRRGHTKARAEEGTGAPLRLDLGVVPEHIARVVHDLAYHETLIDVNRLFRRKEVEAAVRTHYGDRSYDLIQATLQDSAAGEVFAQDALEKGINWLATGSSAATMGLNLQVAIMNMTGFTQAISRLGPVWAAKGVARVIRDAAGWRNAGTWIDSTSPYMRERQRLWLRDAADVNRQLALTGKLEPVRATFHWFVAKMDRAVAIPTWLGAYEKGMAEHGDEEKAIAVADSTVRETQGSNSVHDLASVQRGHPLKRLFTQFYHYFSTTYNLTAESVNRFKGNVEWPVSMPAIGNDVAATARLASDAICLYILPAAIAAGIRMALHPGRKKDDTYGDEFKRETVGMFLGTLPLVRDFASVLTAGTAYKGPTGTRGLEQIGDFVARLRGEFQKPQKDHHLDRAALATLGVILHLPSVQVQRTIDGFVYLQEHGGSPAVLIGGPPRKH